MPAREIMIDVRFLFVRKRTCSWVGSAPHRTDSIIRLTRGRPGERFRALARSAYPGRTEVRPPLLGCLSDVGFRRDSPRRVLVETFWSAVGSAAPHRFPQLSFRGNREPR